jgi:uncharacterized protein (TIGR02646 family)
MREIDSSRRGVIHAHLQNDKVKIAFNDNIKNQKHSTESAYNDGKSDAEDSLKWTLKQIYYEKCAFCESDLKNEVGDIEHFRPKNRNKNQTKKCDKTFSYYWLAFSWDNLLPACSKCNGKKSNCFDIDGIRASFIKEDLKNLHYKTEKYNEREQPKLLHPEYDKFEDEIKFTKKGEIDSENERVLYTVQICDLNRENLRKSRQDIVDDFINDLNKHLVSFDTFYNKKNDNLDMCLEYFKDTIENFCEQSDKQYQYSLIRKYVKDNFEDFLNDLDIKSKDEDFSKYIILVAFESFSK